MKNKIKYRIVLLTQRGSLRGHQSTVWSTEANIEHTNLRDAEKVATELNRRHQIEACAEEVYAAVEI